MDAARSFGHRHPYAYTGVRIAAGTWNLLLGIFLVAQGQRWGAALFAVSALIFWAAYLLAPGQAGTRTNRRS